MLLSICPSGRSMLGTRYPIAFHAKTWEPRYLPMRLKWG
jgi:hypothetical protein